VNRAGFVVTKVEDNEVFIIGCHPTGTPPHKLDLPKGYVNTKDGEPVFIGALRELFEETAIILTMNDLFEVKDLGSYKYKSSKSYTKDYIHLFLFMPAVPIELTTLRCSSLISNSKHPERNGLPEHDGYQYIPIESPLWFDSIGLLLKSLKNKIELFTRGSL
jgi:8-oxo-dGTP pyrophosphatase MutT (NUDIX family)